MGLNIRNKASLEHDLVIIYDDLYTHMSYITGLGAQATKDKINAMINLGKGIVSTCITEKKAKELHLPLMYQESSSSVISNAAVSIDYKDTSTGISASERSQTIKSLHASSNPEDFKKPGHVFPLISCEKNLPDRPGIAETSIELFKPFIENPVTYVCEILNEHGHVSSIHEVQKTASQNHMKIFKMSQIVTSYLKRKKWLDVVDTNQVYVGDTPLTIFNVKNHLYPSQFIVYINADHADHAILNNVTFHDECMCGDVIELHHQCWCPKHLREYMLDMLKGELDGIVYQRYNNDELSSISSLYKAIIGEQIKELVKEELNNTTMNRTSLSV
ncbi:3,4-dihydroxy-2-butanone-4-phosphate synthase [Salibacterium aidingense]|uniref:3,4-dihydroxy-2-butanone-4-phosphate synthase n=1 Tax=Salibacterium aidingense TaxID=384933 RepID=UPI000424719C|nr:3,4-dihydroxy-2-butanone-4-phosphate synthase [Salibacterium aidingense]